MITESRKKRKSKGSPSDGDTRDERVAVMGRNAASRPQAGADVEEMTAKLEKRVEEKLAKLENRLGDEAQSAKKAPRAEKAKPKGTRSDDDSRDDDSKVSVKELKRSTASRPGQGKRKTKGIIERALSLLPGARPRDYRELIDTLEHMDEFGKVPDVETKLEALMLFLYEIYWRVDTVGLENIPNEGRTLIVSNHSGVIPFDGAMMGTAIYEFHPARRYARFLIEDWFGQLPFGTAFMNAVGQVRACQENAERLLRQEQLVGVFPEGIKGMAKGFKDRYNVARFGRGGVIRLAIRTRTPVVPCAVVGAEEIYVVLGYANWLGKIFGLPLLPITPTFPWLGPLGVIPLPTKWYIQFGEMIRYDEYDDSALRDNVIINRLNRQLRAKVQEMVDSALRKRRSLFFG
jgi:1-acyl-sn-glycerol-3-phosphate acyltransferase